MPNALVAAAAIGLPSALFNRRRMLLGLAAASTAAAAPVVYAAGRPAEDPDLIRLGDLTESVAGTHRADQEEVRRIYAEWDQQLPVPPTEITYRRHAFDKRGDWEKRLDGAARHFGEAEHVGIHSVEWLRDYAVYRRGVLTSKPRGATASALARHEKYLARQRTLLAQEETALVLAEKYHAEVDRVMQASGYNPARKRLTAAEDALNAHVSSIMKIEPRTMAGVIVQAQAVEATNLMPGYTTALEASRERWAARLAASILRIASSAA